MSTEAETLKARGYVYLERLPEEEPTDRDRLVTEHLPLVRRLCRRFRHSGEPMEDLVQVGTLGLLKATEKYDPTRGCEFTAFAVPVIVGEIKNYFRDHGWAVKVPRKLQKQRLMVQRPLRASARPWDARRLSARLRSSRAPRRRRSTTALTWTNAAGLYRWTHDTKVTARQRPPASWTSLETRTRDSNR